MKSFEDKEQEAILRPDSAMHQRMDEWNDPPETNETNLWVGLLALLIIFLMGVSLGWYAHILI